MYTNFAITSSPAPSMPLILKAIWAVDADDSYDVTKTGAPEKELVAVRTTKGEGLIIIEGIGRLDLEEGTLLITEYSKIRRYCCPGSCWNFQWFEFYCPADSRMPLNYLVKIEPYEEESYLVRECMKLLRREDKTSACVSSSLFAALLNIWLGNYYSRLTQKNPREIAFRNIAEYIKLNLDKRLNSSDLARQSGLCEKRFRDVFADMFGISPKKYVERQRIMAAKALLTNTSMTICEISEKLGYSSQFHFTREFKKVSGMAPSGFRLGNDMS